MPAYSNIVTKKTPLFSWTENFDKIRTSLPPVNWYSWGISISLLPPTVNPLRGMKQSRPEKRYCVMWIKFLLKETHSPGNPVLGHERWALGGRSSKLQFAHSPMCFCQLQSICTFGHNLLGNFRGILGVKEVYRPKNWKEFLLPICDNRWSYFNQLRRCKISSW